MGDDKELTIRITATGDADNPVVLLAIRSNSAHPPDLSASNCKATVWSSVETQA
jgi:hypothetical protein